MDQGVDRQKQRGIHAENQEFRKYDQVKKDHRYHLVEHADIEVFDCDYQIKTCDMRMFFDGGEEGRRAFAADLGSALEGIGFAILDGHGIDADIFQHAERKVAELFETTTVEERLKYAAKRFGSVNQGY